ncbi:hypothetical protein [Paracoccus pacificus]|uniref:Uncharacterized protein n=1 Tax=Paracoccus pacificus TaxID=1463598 RepID=A0ABW4RAU9_9RHOB
MSVHPDFGAGDDNSGDVLGAIRRLVAARTPSAGSHSAEAMRAPEPLRLVLNSDTLVAPELPAPDLMGDDLAGDVEAAQSETSPGVPPMTGVGPLSIPQALADFAAFVSDDSDREPGGAPPRGRLSGGLSMFDGDVVTAFPMTARHRVAHRHSQDLPAGIAAAGDVSEIVGEPPCGDGIGAECAPADGWPASGNGLAAPALPITGAEAESEADREYRMIRAVAAADLPMRADYCAMSETEGSDCRAVLPGAADPSADPAADPAYPDDLHLRLFSPDDADLPAGSALRTLIRDVIRAELQGETGGRFGRNLRHLIRLEVANAVVTQSRQVEVLRADLRALPLTPGTGAVAASLPGPAVSRNVVPAGLS